MDRDNRNARGSATARALEREAVALATLHGAENVTVDQICAAVGVTQRTFFNHFDTKEDALLGRDLPRVDERRAREYLADPDVGVLSGALTLVQPPQEMLDDPATALARIAIVGASPALARRQAARFAPIALEVEELVALKLRTVAGSEVDETRLRASAHTITAMAAALFVQPGPDGLPTLTAPGHDPSNRLKELDWIWSRLI
jgi:AcrR family transcriptional regulator